MEEDGERDGLRTRGDLDGGRRRDQGMQETRGLRPVMGEKKAGDGFKPTGDGGKMKEGQSSPNLLSTVLCYSAALTLNRRLDARLADIHCLAATHSRRRNHILHDDDAAIILNSGSIDLHDGHPSASPLD